MQKRYALDPQEGKLENLSANEAQIKFLVVDLIIENKEWRLLVKYVKHPGSEIQNNLKPKQMHLSKKINLNFSLLLKDCLENVWEGKKRYISLLFQNIVLKM